MAVCWVILRGLQIYTVIQAVHSLLYIVANCHCNTVDRYRKKEAGTGKHLRHFNNKINKYKWKAEAPHGRLLHTEHKLKSRPGPLSSSTVVTPHLTLPKLLRGTRDRWVAQVSFITIYSTGLAPFPRLSAPPHSPQSFLQCCHMIRYNKIFTKMWGMFSLLWDTVHSLQQYYSNDNTKFLRFLFPWNWYSVRWQHSAEKNFFLRKEKALSRQNHRTLLKVVKNYII